MDSSGRIVDETIWIRRAIIHAVLQEAKQWIKIAQKESPEIANSLDTAAFVISLIEKSLLKEEKNIAKLTEMGKESIDEYGQ